MSKKRTGRKARSVLSIADDRQSDNVPAKTTTNWWGSLSRSSKWLAFGVVAFLSIGVLGSGLKYLEEDAQTQKKLAAKDRSLISSVNPFLAPPSPTPTPQLKSEYIYAGSRLLNVEDANANAAPPADLAVWRPSSGTWYVLSGWVTQSWGASGDIPVPGDFDGDGKTDFSVFRPTTNVWYIIYSSTNGSTSYSYGATGDVPAQADYDGDGKTDAAIYRPPTGGATYGVWHIQGTSAGYYTQSWGEAGDIPASADYDGDGKADLAVWRSGNRKFYSINSSNQSLITIDTTFNPSSPTWTAVSGDYDGDGKADYGVYDSAAANWYIRSSISNSFPTNPVQWGASGDTAVQNDYDADGKVDYATWTNSGTYEGRWHILNSSDASTRNVNWGQASDIPVPALYRR